MERVSGKHHQDEGPRQVRKVGKEELSEQREQQVQAGSERVCPVKGALN